MYDFMIMMMRMTITTVKMRQWKRGRVWQWPKNVCYGMDRGSSGWQLVHRCRWNVMPSSLHLVNYMRC